AGPIKIGSYELELVSCTMKLADDQISGDAKLKVAGSTGNSADITLKYAAGKFDIEGEITIQLSTISSNLSGTIRAKGGTGSGLQEFEGTDCKITKKPFDALTLNHVKYDQSAKSFEADVTLEKDKFALKYVTVNNFNANVKVKSGAGGVDFAGTVSAGVA